VGTRNSTKDVHNHLFLFRLLVYKFGVRDQYKVIGTVSMFFRDKFLHP